MVRIHGWINIYRSGFFHTPGKPGAFDRHPGDIYGTRDDALSAIYPESHYIATVPVTWSEPERPALNAPVQFEERPEVHTWQEEPAISARPDVQAAESYRERG